MHGAPVCHGLTYFTRAPKKLDIDSDLDGATPAKLTDKVTVTRLGSIDGHEAYEVLHIVHSPDVFVKGLKVQDTDLQLAMKILLVERGHAEFCDIYQLQKTEPLSYTSNELHEARILNSTGTRCSRLSIKTLVPFPSSIGPWMTRDLSGSIEAKPEKGLATWRPKGQRPMSSRRASSIWKARCSRCR
jgi:hypothetical protein